MFLLIVKNARRKYRFFYFSYVKNTFGINNIYADFNTIRPNPIYKNTTGNKRIFVEFVNLNLQL
jgi:hypothetical protein